MEISFSVQKKKLSVDFAAFEVCNVLVIFSSYIVLLYIVYIKKKTINNEN